MTIFGRGKGVGESERVRRAIENLMAEVAYAQKPKSDTQESLDWVEERQMKMGLHR